MLLNEEYRVIVEIFCIKPWIMKVKILNESIVTSRYELCVYNMFVFNSWTSMGSTTGFKLRIFLVSVGRRFLVFLTFREG